MLIDRLLKRGFSEAQADLIQRIDCVHDLDLSMIDPDTPIEVLKKIDLNLRYDVYNGAQVILAKMLAQDGHNPLELLNGMEKASDKYSALCYELLAMDYDVRILKEMDVVSFYKIGEAITNGCEVSLKCLENPNLSEALVKKAVFAAESGVEIAPFFNKGYSEEEIMDILNEVMRGNPLGLKRDNSINISVSKEENKSYKPKRNVSDWLRANEDNLIDLIYVCEKRGLDVSAIKSGEYDFNQALVIMQGVLDGINIPAYCNYRNSAEEMRIVLDALLLKREKDVDMRFILDKTVNINSKRAYLDDLNRGEKSLDDILSNSSIPNADVSHGSIRNGSSIDDWNRF